LEYQLGLYIEKYRSLKLVENNQNINPEDGINPLKKYGNNLTSLALEGKIDPVIGREDEIRRIVQILSRRKKNNPIIIGEPGTGKTTVIEGLAKRIVENDVPDSILNKQIISMDLSAMVAGAIYKGQFEERLKNFIDAVKKEEGKIIVFIDEIHMIVGAGGQGQMDIANIIKPELAAGTLKVVGATTLNEYQKYVEKDSALERRFQQVMILEPSIEDTVTILRGIKDKYEVHHGLSIRDSALISASVLSDRYISDRFLPDKAVDLVDEAASKLNIEMNSLPEPIDKEKRRLLQLEIEKASLKKEKDSNSISRLKKCQFEIENIKLDLGKNLEIWDQEKKNVDELTSLRKKLDVAKNKRANFQKSGNYTEASKYQYEKIPSIKSNINQLSDMFKSAKYIKLEVAEEDIADIVSKWTGIPVTKMLSSEKNKLLVLEDQLRKRVIGQEEALQKTSDVIRISKLGLSNAKKPIGSFLFLGNTGVGKTELAKSLSEVLFDDEQSLVRIDMSELMEQHAVSKLIGAPPGYVGYDEGGYLTEKIRRRPYSVILLDEIEKSHPSVLNILLQLLDDGRLTDSKGRTVNFTNTIIIMTSNLDSSELDSFLRPELRNRIDEIINFNNLDKNVIEKIVDQHLQRMVTNVKQQGLVCKVNESLRKFIIEMGYQPEYGARPIRRIIQSDIMPEISRTMLQFPDKKEITISYEGGHVCCA
jgi:ATP-dependent Clp protease ATP-binding subunit ClpB